MFVCNVNVRFVSVALLRWVGLAARQICEYMMTSREVCALVVLVIDAWTVANAFSFLGDRVDHAMSTVCIGADEDVCNMVGAEAMLVGAEDYCLRSLDSAVVLFKFGTLGCIGDDVGSDVFDTSFGMRCLLAAWSYLMSSFCHSQLTEAPIPIHGCFT